MITFDYLECSDDPSNREWNQYRGLATRIEEAWESLTYDRYQDMYLLRWGGKWLIVTSPREGARLFGRFNREIPMRDFSEAVYEELNQARPG